MKGDLAEQLRQGRHARSTAHLNPDRAYTAPDGGSADPARRACMLVRNVGHLMTTDAVLDETAPRSRKASSTAWSRRCARCTTSRRASGLRNSRTGSVYIVKPKMHGPEEVALAVRPVRPRRGRAGTAAQHAQDRHHGRGAAHHGQPQGVHPRRARAGHLHQHRLPRPHRRRDPHRHGSRPDAAQGRHEDRALDPGLRGLERRHRARLRASAATPRSARACGPCPTRWREMLETKIAPPAGRRQLRLGALAHRRHPARDALPPGRRGRAPGASSPDAAARQPRRHPAHPAARRPQPGRPRRSSRNSTTTPRASSATWCAGSTRASAAPRCRTSTTSA